MLKNIEFGLDLYGPGLFFTPSIFIVDMGDMYEFSINFLTVTFFISWNKG